MREGWTMPLNSPLWHYFVNNWSLCGDWELWEGDDALVQVGDNVLGNCYTCRRILQQRKDKDNG